MPIHLSCLQVKVDMGQPILNGPDVPTKLPSTKNEAVVQAELAIDGLAQHVTCVSMGNPHCITFGAKELKVINLEVQIACPEIYFSLTNFTSAYYNSKRKIIKIFSSYLNEQFNHPHMCARLGPKFYSLDQLHEFQSYNLSCIPGFWNLNMQLLKPVDQWFFMETLGIDRLSLYLFYSLMF